MVSTFTILAQTPCQQCEFVNISPEQPIQPLHCVEFSDPAVDSSTTHCDRHGVLSSVLILSLRKTQQVWSVIIYLNFILISNVISPQNTMFFVEIFKNKPHGTISGLHGVLLLLINELSFPSFIPLNISSQRGKEIKQGKMN